MELEMVCVCEQDGFREAEDRRLRVFGRMGLDYMENLTEAVVFSLAFDFQAEADVAADMWFGVSLKTPLIDEAFFIQCDWPADGLLAVWENLAERFPEKVTVNDANASAVRVADRISAALFRQYETADATYQLHRQRAHNNEGYHPSCEDCSVFLELRVKAQVQLNEAWGCRVLDPTIDKAFRQ